MKRRKSFLKKALSYMLIAAMCVPDVAPMAAYAADYAANRPRYVSFDLPDPLKLEDLNLPDGDGSSSGNAGDRIDGTVTGGNSWEDRTSESVMPTESASPDTDDDTANETVETEPAESETSPVETSPIETTEAAETPAESEDSETAAQPDDVVTDESKKEMESLAELPKETKEAQLREPDFFYTEMPAEPEGILVDVSDQGSTYLVEENVGTDENGESVNSYITVIGKNFNYYKDGKGQIRSYNNTLLPIEDGGEVLSAASPSNARRAITAVAGTRYENAKGSAKVQIPEHMGSGKGYLISDGEHTLELIPTAGDFSHSLVADNAIRYSDVFENVDFQYTVIGDTVKEDIILMEKQDRHTFSYKLKSDGLNFKKHGNAVVAYNETVQKPVFRITAPVLIDSDNQTSIEIKVKYDSSSHTVTFDADKTWLNDPDRVYPVRIDPGAELVGYDAFSINMVAKGDTEKMAGTGKVDDKVRSRYFGDDGHTMVGYSRDYGHCRAMINIDTAWESLINHPATQEDGKGVKNVQFSVGILTQDTPQRTPFMLRVLKKSWDPSSVSFANAASAMDSSIPTGAEAYSSGSGGRIEFDITDAYYGWLDGKDRFGLLLEVEAENEFDPSDLQSVFWAETLYNRSGMKNGPRLEVAWEGKLKDPSVLTMADFSLDIGPGVAESEAGGRTTRGILAHGASQVDSTINYTVYRKSDDEAVAGGTVTALNTVDCPDYQTVDPDCLPFERKDSNWQTDPVLYGEELKLNTIYYVWAQGTGYKVEEPGAGEPGGDDSSEGSGEDSGEESREEELSEPKQSDPFLLYEVQATDLLSRIARHYGLTIKELKEDNQFLDQLTVAGDVLFIRKPSTEKPYTKPLNPDKLEEMLLKLLMEGRDPRCAFGMEPVNLSNGSFYMSQTDAQLTDLGGSFPIERSYNSLTPYFRSEFGMGWNSLTGEKIMVLQDGTIIYIREDGKGLTFEKSGNKTYKGPEGYGYELKAVNYLDVLTEQGERPEPEPPSPAGKAVTLSDKDSEAAAVQDQTESSGENDGGIEKVPSSVGWELTGTDGVVKQFNSSGLLVTEKDRKGFATYYEYDSDNLLQRIVSPGGKEFAITQTEEKGLITQIVLPDGGILSYEYNEDDDLISAVNPAGGVRRYEYDSEHHMTAWYDENGVRVVKNIYDEEGRVISQTDALGYTGTLQYSDGLTVLTDNNGNVTRYYQDSQYRNIRIDYADGTSSSTVYNEQNQAASRTDEKGTTTAYTYDENGNVLMELRADGTSAEFTYNDLNLPLTVRDYEGNVSSYTYDDIGNLLSSADGAGNTISYSYDSLNRLISMTDAEGGVYTYEYDGSAVISSTDPEGYTCTYTYDAMNRLLTSVNPAGETTTHVYNANGWETETVLPGQGTSVYEFSPVGEVLSITDGMGVKTTFTYDAMHNILSGLDALGNTLTYTYDGNYNRVTETDGKGNTTTYQYDARDRISSVRDALGNSTIYKRDGLGNVTSLTDRRGGTKEYWYHKVLGLPTMSKDALGNETYYRYDGNGQLVKITYSDGSEITFQYDGAGRLTQKTARNGLVTEMDYDGNGNIITIKDDETRVYYFEYDGNNRLVKTTDPLGGVTAYTYDKAGRQTRFTDQENHSTMYAYDAAGRMTEMKNAMEGMTSMAYNLNGSLVSSSDENGGVSEYHYDVLGQLLAAVNPAGGITAMEYDSLGNIVKSTDALKGETSLEYDALSRTTKVTDAMGHEYLYEYDEEGNLVKETMPDKDTVTLTYDKGGQVICAEDEAGVVTTYTYDAMGNIIMAEDNTGNRMFYEYDVAGNLVKQTDTIGREALYTYDKFNRPVSVMGTDGAVTAYSYDALDRLTSVTQADGTVTSYEYDKAGNLIKTTEPGEAVYTYSYDAINRLTAKVNPLGAATEFYYDAKGNLTGTTDPESVQNSYVYDVLDRLTNFTDGRGNTTVYGYDELSRLLSYTTPEGNMQEYRYDGDGNMTKMKDANGLITEYQYDVMGNVIRAISPKGARTTYTYDKHDEMTSITDPAGNLTKYEVDLNRQVTKMIQKNGGEYTYSYDAVHRMTEITTPLGLKRSFTYDAADNVIKDTDSLERGSSHTYDIMHRMTRSVDSKGGVTEFGYDIRGNQNKLTDALHYTWNYQYDLADQLTASTDPEGKATEVVYNLVGKVNSITKPGGRTTTYEYDGNYNVAGITDPRGFIYGYTYDKDNRQTGTVDPLGQTTQTAYDAGNRVTSLKDKMGLTQFFEYDPHGNVLSSKATNGLITRFNYDILDNLLQVTMPSDLTTNYTYDVMGNVISMTDTMKRVTKYAYDLEGNLTSIKDPMGRTEKLTYDASGRLTDYTSNGGNKINYNYDTLNSLVEKSYKDDRDAEGREGVLYGYDALGQRVSMMDRSGESRYEYDGLGRITKVTTGSGEVTSYQYDGSDQLESITYPDGRKVSYQYDKNDNLTEVTDRTGAVTAYVYDAINRITEIHRPNGVSTYNTYNARDQIVSMKNLCDDCDWVVSQYDYTYDDRGFITGEDAVESLYGYAFDDKHNGKHENWHDELYPHGDKHNNKHDKDGIYGFQIIGTKRVFTYDKDGKLLTATENEDRQGKTDYTFKYDDMGNRTSFEKIVRGKKAEAAEYTYNDSNQLTSARLYDGKHWKNVEYTNDADGNRTMQEEVKPDGTRKTEYVYEYTVENRLKAVSDKNDLLTAMAYDGDGNRIFQLNYNLHTDDDWKGNSGNGNGNNKDNTGSGNSGNATGNGTESKADILSETLADALGTTEKEPDFWNKITAFFTGTEKQTAEDTGSVETLSSNKDKDKGNNGNDKNNGKGNGNGNGSKPNDNTSTGGINDNTGNANGNTNNTDGSQNQSGILFPIEGEVSELEQELIDKIKTTGKQKNYELVEYVNDVNRDYAEVLMELNINGIMDTAYSYGDQRLTSERFNGWTGYYTYDGRGSVSGVTDEEGMIWQSYRYDAFGEISFGSPQYNNVYGYNGESYNPNMDSQYLRARYYQPVQGRFLQEDSYLGDITDPLTLNRYVYTKASPLNYTDPSGFYYESGGLPGGEKTSYDHNNPPYAASQQSEEYWNNWASGYENLNSTQKKQLAGQMNKAQQAAMNSACTFIDIGISVVDFITSLAWGAIAAVIQNGDAPVTFITDIPKMIQGKPTSAEEIDMAFGSLAFNKTAYYMGKLIGDIASVLAGIKIALAGTSAAGAGLAFLTGSAGSSLVITAGGISIVYTGSAIITSAVIGVVDASGKLGVEISQSSASGGTSDSNKGDSKPAPEELAEKVPNKYKKNLKCEEFANEMEKLMKESGVTGEKLDIQSKTGYIWSDQYGSISENGYHHAVKVGDTVFDNLNPKGVSYSDWISDLGILEQPWQFNITTSPIG